MHGYWATVRNSLRSARRGVRIRQCAENEIMWRYYVTVFPSSLPMSTPTLRDFAAKRSERLLMADGERPVKK
ncbi:hypothetical protein EVAR_21908_1 [Eumeta japonica]|uniref:Uncharacterized protein n=1 Tax=Eumeta variegata TaxID=151549 RepID=A0A4C1XF89_EUMVA|nr:hypothetical protein EVAR_21908_1 [Eumeta japonica]